MSQVILKKSSVPGKVPLVTDLAYGELAINYADGIAYFKKSDNTIGTIGSSAFSQAKNYTYTATAGQTSFACNYDFNRVYVYLNGVKQVLDTDFTASTGTSIDFVSGLIAGDIVDIVSYSGSNDIPPLPTTDIIGASDVQTLTNKTISFANNTLTGVQAELLSGTNIKTINNTSILGSGNISIVETDPVFVASEAYDITSTNKTNWNSAYSWGNHANAGYLTSISSSQVTTALGYTPINITTKGAVNGIASLDSSGLVPSTQLPSYVDDVLEYANLANFPATGETGKIYVALDTNKTYRWSGSTYIYITSGAVDSVAGKTGVVTLTSGDVGLGSVENKSSDTIRSEITSSNITTALGFTPYNSTNPSGYITSSALSPYQLASTAITTSNIGSQSVNYATSAGSATTVSNITRGSAGASDLNTVVTSGFYRVNDANANSPGSYGQLLVVYGGSDTIGQLYFDYSTGNTFSRAGNPSNVGGGGSWSAWKTNLNSGNYNSYAPTLTGGGASGTWGINVTGSSASCSGNSATATIATNVNAPDGDRNAGTKLPNTNSRNVRFDFCNAGTAGTGGNYAGVMTYAPWDGTTASTGDASYQLAFGSTAANGGGVPQLNIRKGIDTTWNSWYTIIHTGYTTANQQFNSLGIGTAASGTAGEIRATNNITAYYSDGRLKTVVGKIEGALSAVQKINGVYYTGNEAAAEYGYDTKEMQVGVIAQEIQAVLPQVVTRAPFDIAQDEDGVEYSKSGKEYLTVRYEKIVPLLIEAIKEQQLQLDSLRQQVESIRG